MKPKNNTLFAPHNDANDTTGNASGATPVAPVPPKRKIAVVSTSVGLAAAFAAILAPRNADAEIVTVTKLTDAPIGSTIAHLGLPPFIPGASSVKVLSMGTKMVASSEERSAQWTTLRDKNVTCEDALAELANPEEYLVIPGRALAKLKLELAEVRIAIAESETPEQKADAYKRGFEMLRGQLSI